MAAFVAAVAFVSPSCGPHDAETVEAGSFAVNCSRLAPDQKASLMPFISLRGMVDVLIDDRFGADHVTRIHKAIEIWNDFMARNPHAGPDRPFRAVLADLKSRNTPDSAGDCDFSVAASQSIPIVREEDPVRWQAMGLKGDNPGVTLRCYRNSALVKQVVLLNLSQADHLRQLTSITLHELGHAIGLGHSCAGESEQARTGFTACGAVRPNHPYAAAVLFPVLQGVKEELRQNDVDRALCVTEAQ